MKSYWEEEHKEFEEIKQDKEASVCIIGGGITGISTAYYLSKYKKVIVLEKDRLFSKTSGKNTGKVTSQHGLFYDYLINSQSEDFAKKYLEANENAINNIENIIKEENINCDFERENAYVFTNKKDELEKIKNEVYAVNKLEENLCTYKQSLELPFKTLGAIEFKNQAKIHPIKYGYGLVKSILKNNGEIFENSQVTNITKKENRYEVEVNGNKVITDYIVIATRYPNMSFPGYYFLKMYQSTSFAMVFDCKSKLINGMYISAEVPTMSFRTIKEKDKTLLLVVGYDYKTGSENVENGYVKIEEFVKNIYPEAQVLYKWTAEDCISLDKIPYIGEFSNIMENIYVATGFNKWGLTTSNIAAQIISDKILEKENKYEEIFKSTRMEPIKNIDEVKNMLGQAGKSIVLSRFEIPEEQLKDIKNGEGKIVNINDTKVGIYKTDNGEIYKVKPICTHLGCELHFNNIEKVWECPCHGSKFNYKGESIEVPSNKDLEEEK